MHVAATSKRRVDVNWRVISCSSASRRTGVLQVYGCWLLMSLRTMLVLRRDHWLSFDGLLEENNASEVLGLLGDQSLGVEKARSC